MFMCVLFKGNVLILLITGILIEYVPKISWKVLLAYLYNHMFAFPENYGATNESIDLSDDDIQDVPEVSGVMDEEHIVNFIYQNTKQQCVGLIPNPEKIEAKNAIEAYRFLKQNIPDPLGTLSYYIKTFSGVTYTCSIN